MSQCAPRGRPPSLPGCGIGRLLAEARLMGLFIHTYIHIYIYRCVGVYMFIYIYIHVYVCVYMCACIYIYILIPYV